jgi:hypothetical protein
LADADHVDTNERCAVVKQPIGEGRNTPRDQRDGALRRSTMQRCCTHGGQARSLSTFSPVAVAAIGTRLHASPASAIEASSAAAVAKPDGGVCAGFQPLRQEKSREGG